MKWPVTFFILICAALACSKSKPVTPPPPPPPPPPADTTIYIGGSSTNIKASGIGVVWKNGFASPVPDSSMIISLSYTGTSLYALGISGNYSVNGVQPALQSPYPGSAILATGTDVYIPSRSQIFPGDAIYWKSGQIINLSNNSHTSFYSGNANGIAQSGSDIYICGSIRETVDSDYKAVYWKNDSIHYIPNGYVVWYITVSGDNVYIGGSAGPLYAYWVNGQVNRLTTSDIVTGIAVSGSDVYVCGYNEHGFNTGFYLKNGQKTFLPSSLAVSGIAVLGSDVYCVGSDNSGNAVYWENTDMHILGPGSANCILIHL